MVSIEVKQILWFNSNQNSYR